MDSPVRTRATVIFSTKDRGAQALTGVAVKGLLAPSGRGDRQRRRPRGISRIPLIEMTRHHMARSHQLFLRFYRGTFRLGQRTARMEPAATWRVDGRGHFATQDNLLAFNIR